MKRRLNRAYDNMIMPDGCVHRIEQKLNDQLQQQKTGQYIKSISPVPVRRKGWAAAVAAVCLVLVLSVGGSMLFWHVSEKMLMSKDTIVTSVTEETTRAQTPEDHYALVTDISAAEVEAFAKIVRQNILEENWKALSDKIRYPISIQEQEVEDPWSFSEWMNDISLGEDFMKAISDESCTGLFCNWQGICMGDGKIWINEVEGELKITAINVDVQEEPAEEVRNKLVPMEFAPVLSGWAVKFTGSREELILEEYCAALWGAVSVDGFAVVDMDGDGVCEVVASARTAEGEAPAHLVLRLEGSDICSYPFWPGEMYDLKKDGSFGSSKGGPGQGSFRLTFEGKGSCQMNRAEESEGVSEVMWHTYPCQGAAMLLQSYEYVTGTGQSLLPSNPYYHFEGLVLGSMGNDWNLQKEQMVRYGMICVEEEGTVSVFDPDAPGTALYGTLTNENGVVQFSELGYYICTADKEYQAEVRELLSEEPQYVVDAHLAALGSMGRQVYTPEELIAYFGFTQYSDAVISERHAAKAVVEKFTIAWIARDEKVIKQYLADDFQEDTRKNGTEYFPAGTPEIMAIRDLPHRGGGMLCHCGVQRTGAGQLLQRLSGYGEAEGRLEGKGMLFWKLVK